jgi:hypothetical protein
MYLKRSINVMAGVLTFSAIRSNGRYAQKAGFAKRPGRAGWADGWIKRLDQGKILRSDVGHLRKMTPKSVFCE